MNLNLPPLNVEMIGVRLRMRVRLRRRAVILMVLYIPPLRSVNNYAVLFKYLVQEIGNSHHVVISGDFNIPEVEKFVDGRNSTLSTHLSITYLNIIVCLILIRCCWI